jgi:hypothetical protein
MHDDINDSVNELFAPHDKINPDGGVGGIDR